MINVTIVNEQDEELLIHTSKFLHYSEGRTIVLNSVDKFGNIKATCAYKILSITHVVSYVNDLNSQGVLVVVRPIDKESN